MPFIRWATMSGILSISVTIVVRSKRNTRKNGTLQRPVEFLFFFSFFYFFFNIFILVIFFQVAVGFIVDQRHVLISLQSATNRTKRGNNGVCYYAAVPYKRIN